MVCLLSDKLAACFGFLGEYIIVHTSPESNMPFSRQPEGVDVMIQVTGYSTTLG
jgi:hypothetical protein